MLDAVAQGDEDAASRLWEAVYHEVHQMAASRLLSEKKTSGLQAGLIVNEIYMRICRGYSDRGCHFMAHACSCEGVNEMRRL